MLPIQEMSAPGTVSQDHKPLQKHMTVLEERPMGAHPCDLRQGLIHSAIPKPPLPVRTWASDQ